MQAAARWPLLSVETAKQFAAETGPVLLLSDLDLAVTTNFSGLLSLTGFRVNVACQVAVKAPGPILTDVFSKALPRLDPSRLDLLPIFGA